MTTYTIVKTTVATALLVACQLTNPLPAQPQKPTATRASMLTTAAWLTDHLHDANVVVLQVGSKAQFDAGHIPGARPVALSDISLPASETRLSLEMPMPGQLKAWAEAQGIGNTTTVIVVPYDSVLQSATRVYLTLAYMGAMNRTMLLDGGLPAWRADNRAVVTEAPATVKAAVFDLKLRPELLANVQDVERATEKRTSIIDARLPKFYNGDPGSFSRGGHIPTAINVPLNTVSERGFLKDEPSLRKLFGDAGVTAGKPVVTYCHIGQQASLLWFVSTMLGYDTRLYDGSFQEWSGIDRLPVVGGKP